MAKTLFFCGIGGSGMSALAAICARKGYAIAGSDRARDNGQTPEKFTALERLGIRLFPQDGSGLSTDTEALIVSSAVEESIPDVRAAREKGVPIRKRAELLAELFNRAPLGISVAGTSGKTTVTGMIAVMLQQAGLDPTVMNGGIMLNFAGQDSAGLGNMRVGEGEAFVAETDESDGSIALYDPKFAIINNVALDHKSMDELQDLFGAFIARASKGVVLNADDPRLRALASRARVPVHSISLHDPAATLFAFDLRFSPGGVDFALKAPKYTGRVALGVPGAHNVANALAALALAHALELDMASAIDALATFKGIRRRLEVVGQKNEITVIDDFAHNPDKITASLKALNEFPGRKIVMFQPHGFGPLKLMGREIAAAFREQLGPEDYLLMPEAYYAGGTVDRSVTAHHLVEDLKAQGLQARWFAARAESAPFILNAARPGDRIIIMGARDDTLSDFAREILEGL